jgi:hypothetical protein
MFFRYIVEHIRVPGRPNIRFTGRVGDVWWVFVLLGLCSYGGSVDYISVLLLIVVVQAFLSWMMLRWIVGKMDERYKTLQHKQVRNIEGYNRAVAAEERLPYWVVVVDELADLMMVSAGEVQNSLVRLAQIARAVGIHLIIATQRPSVDVVTGLIKANVPSRLAVRSSEPAAELPPDCVVEDDLAGGLLFEEAWSRFLTEELGPRAARRDLWTRVLRLFRETEIEATARCLHGFPAGN